LLTTTITIGLMGIEL